MNGIWWISHWKTGCWKTTAGKECPTRSALATQAPYNQIVWQQEGIHYSQSDPSLDLTFSRLRHPFQVPRRCVIYQDFPFIILARGKKSPNDNTAASQHRTLSGDGLQLLPVSWAGPALSPQACQLLKVAVLITAAAQSQAVPPETKEKRSWLFNCRGRLQPSSWQHDSHAPSGGWGHAWLQGSACLCCHPTNEYQWQPVLKRTALSIVPPIAFSSSH